MRKNIYIFTGGTSYQIAPHFSISSEAYGSIGNRLFKEFFTSRKMSTKIAHADDYTDDEVYYSDEDDELFNRGKFVGKESDDYEQMRRRMQTRNWSIALSSTAVGIATLLLVGKNH